jgi:hypothetical protein
MTRALLEQALEALDSCTPGDYSTGHVIHPSYGEYSVNAAIEAIRAHLAILEDKASIGADRVQPQGEPVAMVVDPYDTPGLQWLCQHPPARGVRLYTYPAQPEGEPVCARCESLGRAVMMDQTAHDMNLVAEKYAHKLALDLECVLSDYSGKWWNAAIETIDKYRKEMNAIHERESPTWMGEPRL